MSISCVRAESDLSNKFVTCTRTKTSCTFKLKVVVKFNMLRLVLCAGVTRLECGCRSIFCCLQFHIHCPVPPTPSGSSELIAV